MTQPPRIVSLVPAGTDIVAALGLSGSLVGVSHDCEQAMARGRTVLTESTLDDRPGSGHPALSPSAIDTRVRTAARDEQPLYRVDREALEALGPDVVISQSVCDVCAVDADELSLPDGACVLDLRATTIDGLYEDLMRVGEACEREDAALEIVEAVRVRLHAVRDNVGSCEPVSALALEWSSPPYVGGHWVPEMFALAGGEHALGRPGEPARRAGWDELQAADPEAVVFVPCGYPLERALQEGQRLAADLGELRAHRERRLWAANASALFSRCSPQSVARGTEVLAGILHPSYAPRPKPHEAQRLL